MSENMRIHVKNVLAGIGTMAILAVALMIAIPNFANYDLGSTGSDSSLYSDKNEISNVYDTEESVAGVSNPCPVGTRVCVVKKYVDPNVPPYDLGAFDFKLTQGDKVINFSLKGGELYAVDNKAGLVKWHRDDAKKQNTEDSFDTFNITEITQLSNIKTSYSCHRGIWEPATGKWFAELDKSSGNPPYPALYIKGDGNNVEINNKRAEGFYNPETGRPFDPQPFYSVLCEFTNTLITAPVGNTAKLTIIKDYVPGQSPKVFPFEITGKNSDGKVFNTQTIRLNDDGIGDLDPKSQYPKQYTFTIYTTDNLGKILSYDISETPDSTTNAKYLCKIKVPAGYRAKPDIKGTGTKLNFIPGPGEEIVCTFTNTKKGYIPVYEEGEPYTPPINP